MICAKRHELKKMFEQHYIVYNSVKPNSKESHKLLLFYAVECGLKVLLLKKINGNTIKAFSQIQRLRDNMDGKKGHNLRFILKELGYGNFSLPSIPCKNGEIAECMDYNQVWRYGIEVDKDKEMLIEMELCKIAQWVERRI